MLIIGDMDYPNEAGRPIGKCYQYTDKPFMLVMQREKDVLFINCKKLLITTHDLGFLTDEAEDRLDEVSLETFAEALNHIIFNMDILNKDFKF